MPAAADVIYRYDGSFEGFLCCVFASYDYKEIPVKIYGPEDGQLSLLFLREIITEPVKAQRVWTSVCEKIGRAALGLMQKAFCSCMEQKELAMLLFLRAGYRYGPAVMSRLADRDVHRLLKAVRHLENESHLLCGFIRFASYSGMLVARIGPKNYVLPFIADHFQQRYPEERFLIYDEIHKMALVYQPYEISVASLDRLELPVPDEGEVHCQNLWQVFYDAVEIQSRHNPKCRRNMMPKRYWPYMTEFDRCPVPPSGDRRGDCATKSVLLS